MNLAEYNHHFHPPVAKQVKEWEGPKEGITMVSIPTAKITTIKVFVMIAIALAAVLPREWAFWTMLVANAYWMFKL